MFTLSIFCRATSLDAVIVKLEGHSLCLTLKKVHVNLCVGDLRIAMVTSFICSDGFKILIEDILLGMNEFCVFSPTAEDNYKRSIITHEQSPLMNFALTAWDRGILPPK